MPIIPLLEEKVNHKLGAIKLNVVKQPKISDPLLNNLIHASGHDLRSPLFVIRSYAQLLQRTQDKSRLKRGFELIEGATQTMENLIGSLVHLIDIYTLPVPTTETISFQEILEKTKFQLCNEIEYFRPVISADFSICQEVKFSYAYLQEIMFNLIDNAMRHNAQAVKLHINIRTFYKNDRLVLEIKDNGRGIENEQEKEKIKQPFYSNTNDAKCIGNGLSKVQGIAQVCQKNFEIESVLGQGVCCRFYF